MYSAPDFVKVSVQPTTAFASTSCTPSWKMDNWEYMPSCVKITFIDENPPGMEYACYFNQNAPS